MSKIAILICSCDYYSDCWEPMIFSLNKFWPDCEYDKLIVSNHIGGGPSGASIIKVGEHKGWASDTLMAVELTDYDYYIYFQEDYWLNKSVNSEAIKKHILHCEENNVEYLKIEPDLANCDRYRIGDSIYCKNPLIDKYSINTAIAIWRRSLFLKVCVPGYTGWDFERNVVNHIKNNRIIINSETLISSEIVTQGITTIKGKAVQRGKWTPAGVNFLYENGFEELINHRKKQSRLFGWCYSKLSLRNKFTYYPMAAILILMRKFNLD